MHIKGFGKILWLKKLSNLCNMLEWLLFHIPSKKQKNKLDTEQDLCLPKKR